jgi:YesN/AraC family two-component response regulator
MLNPYKEFIKSETGIELLQKLEKILLFITDQLGSNKNRYDIIVEKVKNYLEANYHKHDTSLEGVSEYIGMSYCHLSVIFKRVTGKTFMEYLTQLRIEKAKNLILSTNMLFYEIADAVGYESPTYFSEVFKKRIGMSPTGYRKNK